MRPAAARGHFALASTLREASAGRARCLLLRFHQMRFFCKRLLATCLTLYLVNGSPVSRNELECARDRMEERRRDREALGIRMAEQLGHLRISAEQLGQLRISAERRDAPTARTARYHSETRENRWAC